MADPRKERHVFETDVKNRLRSAREAVGDAVSLLEEAGADPAAAREKVLSSLGGAEFEEDRLEALADALDQLGAWKGSLSVRAMAEEPLKKAAKLSWPFPRPSSVLKNPQEFILYAQSVYPSPFSGRRGEVSSARKYLWQLRQVEAPLLARTIRAEMRQAAAAGDADKTASLRRWWAALAAVLKLLARMVRLVNEYEKSPGYSKAPGWASKEPAKPQPPAKPQGLEI